ncbi:MAG: CHRD domain-containing protein [Candidatus Eremiobacteraeota bacterium]|nr:CHRD domain-containing protein [Candidatus Eremiobacteraeota bacterium]MBV9647401.1 CHRD domain-containing protein [Candidatus Eremiobacteraeota bacterium]
MKRSTQAASALTTLAALLLAGLGPALSANMGMTSTRSIQVKMKAQNGSNESGTATLMQEGTNVIVKISISNGSAKPQPAHIHTGTCANLNPAPKYPLSSVVNGVSTTTLKDLKMTSLENGDFAINVHKSLSDLKTYVSCGDIPKLKPMTGM